MKKKLSIADIARQLNISKTTVSFVLNGKAAEYHISETLEKRILDYIQEVDYRPNQFAQALRTGKTKIIGMMVEDISDPFFASVARMIEESAYRKGYKIVYCSTENDTQKTKDFIQVYRTRQVDGYIIAPPQGIEKEIQSLLDDNLPVVLFDRTIPGLETDDVLVDNFKSAYDAMHHFIKNGYKNISMITLESDQVQMTDRVRGYKKAMDEIMAPHRIKKIIYHDDKENSINEIQEYIASNPKLDAVFFATNYIADNGLEAIRNLRLNIPNELGVIVFDDYNLFRLFTPSITAISQPIKEISEQTIGLMLARLEENKKLTKYQHIVLPTTLMVRESSVTKSDVESLI